MTDTKSCLQGSGAVVPNSGDLSSGGIQHCQEMFLVVTTWWALLAPRGIESSDAIKEC